MVLARLILMLPLAAPPQPLAAYVDHNRVLLVFAPADTDVRFEQQMGLLSHHAAALKERDLVVLPNVVHSSTSSADTLRTLNSPYPTGEQQLDQRTRFHVGPGEFTVILLGKDGGEKLRQHTPIAVGGLSATIDAMPMRQEEMRKQK